MILLAALPFAARQSEHLSSGGFGVPGSQSAAVDGGAGAASRASPRAQLAAVLIPAARRDAGAAPRRGRPGRRGRRPGRRASRCPTPRARAADAPGRAPAATVVVPLRADVDEDDATDVAVDLRERARRRRRRARRRRPRHLVGQGALWAAMQELSKEDLAKAESAGFPIVLLILLARLRLARRRGAAARARLRRPCSSPAR